MGSGKRARFRSRPGFSDVKAASAPLAALINSGLFASFPIYTFTLTSGLVIRLTTADFDVNDGSGNIFHCGSIDSGYPRIDTAASRATSHQKRGIASDQWNVTILPTVMDPRTGALTYPDVAGSTPWLTACRTRMFDNADVVIGRAYYALPAPSSGDFSLDFSDDLWGTVIAAPPLSSQSCIGALVIFRGTVGHVNGTQTSTAFQIDDYKTLLSLNIPRNLYQAECRHQLFDAGCTLSASAFVQTGTVGPGSSRTTIVSTLPAPSGSGTYQLGTISFTSGMNIGLQRTVAGWDGSSVLTLMAPFPFSVAIGDAFNIWPGCTKSMASCTAFGNLVNFGAEPFVPVPEMVLG